MVPFGEASGKVSDVWPISVRIDCFFWSNGLDMVTDTRREW